MKRDLPTSTKTPAPKTATHGSAQTHKARAPLALVEPATASPGPKLLKSFEGDEKVEAKALLQVLEFELAKYPQFTNILMLSIEPMRANVRRRQKSDRDLVFDVVTQFDSVTLEDLLDDTHLSAARVCAALLNLIEVGLVDCRTSGGQGGTKLDPSVKHLLQQIFARPDHKHLKGDLRAEYLFCLTHVPAGSNYSGPSREHSATRAMTEFLQS